MSSKFKGIFEARQREAEATPEEAPPPSPAPVSPPQDNPKTTRPALSPSPPKRRGRPTGKRSDGEHVQVTAYIRRETHQDVKIALLREGKGQEFSELVQDLLTKWLRSRT